MRYLLAAFVIIASTSPCLASDKQMFDWMALLKVSNAECPGQTYDIERIELIGRILAVKLGWSDDKASAEWVRAVSDNEARLVEDREVFCALGPAYLATLTPEAKHDLGFIEQ